MMPSTKFDEKVQLSWTTWLPELEIDISLNHISIATDQYIIYACVRTQVSNSAPYGPLVLETKSEFKVKVTVT